jgi:hypothetical protein
MAWFPNDANGLNYGNAGGYLRGWLESSVSTSSASSVITAKAEAWWMKSYLRWLRLTIYINSTQVYQSAATRITSLYADWHLWINSGEVTSTVTRSTIDQTVVVKAVLDVYNDYSSPSVVASYETTQAVIVPARVDIPSAPTIGTNTRNSDNQNTIRWTRNATTFGIYSSLVIERSIDGGGFSDLVSVAGTSTSHADTTTLENHFYAYRVRAVNSAGFATSGSSTTTYNTPAVPTNLSASRIDAATVSVAFTNNALTETGVGIQRSANNTSWSTLASVEGFGLSAVIDAPPGGTWYYRLRTTRGTLYSSWSEPSKAVITITPPSAPTLVLPISGATINRAGSAVRFQWTHNPLDGSAQSAYQLRHSTNGGSSWTTVSGTTATYRDLAAATWAVNATVTWQVATKGADATYGPWSASRTFTVHQVPQASVILPAANNAVITTLPITLTWSYSDQSGTQQSATLSLMQDTREVWRHTLTGTDSSYTLGAGEFLPENNTAYTLQLTVVSTSTLSAVTSRTFSTAYAEPAPPVVMLEIDGRAGIVKAVLTAVSQSGVPATQSLGLFRRLPDGTVTDLGQGLLSGSAVIDRFAPTEMEIAYVAISSASSGAIAQTVRQITVLSAGAVFFNYGQDYRTVAKLVANPTQSENRSHDRVVMHTAGAEKPLVFYGANTTRKGSRSGVVLPGCGIWPTEDDPSTLVDMEALSKHRGDVVMRLPGQQAFLVDLTVSMDTSEPLAKISVAWQEVRKHDGLAL